MTQGENQLGTEWKKDVHALLILNTWWQDKRILEDSGILLQLELKFLIYGFDPYIKTQEGEASLLIANEQKAFEQIIEALLFPTLKTVRYT